jgi:hypothetical protein
MQKYFFLAHRMMDIVKNKNKNVFSKITFVSSDRRWPNDHLMVMRALLSSFRIKYVWYTVRFLTVTIGNCVVKIIPPVNFCSDENNETIFGTNLEDFLNYRIDHNSTSLTVEKVVKTIFCSAPVSIKECGILVGVESLPTLSPEFESC